MNRFKRWVIRKAVAHFLRRLEMQPLPKAAGVLGWFGVIGAGLGSIAGILPAKYAAIVSSVAGLLSLFSHSLTGDGGKPR